MESQPMHLLSIKFNVLPLLLPKQKFSWNTCVETELPGLFSQNDLQRSVELQGEMLSVAFQQYTTKQSESQLAKHMLMTNQAVH